jgi:dipeptidyl aminopeptidase/acylaminoacyl peptidase
VRTGILVFVFACVCAQVAYAEAPPSAEAYGRLPAIGSAALSPDGSRVAVSAGDGSFSVINLETGKEEQRIAPSAETTLFAVGWADERRPYYNIRARVSETDLLPHGMFYEGLPSRVEVERTNVLSLDTGKIELLLKNENVRGNLSLVGLQSPVEGDPGFGRMVAWYDFYTPQVGSTLTVFRVNLDTGVDAAVEKGNTQTDDFVLDERGKVIARTDNNHNKKLWRLFSYEGGKAREILEGKTVTGMSLWIYGLLEDGRIAASYPHEAGKPETWQAIDLKTGRSTPLEVLQRSPGSDISPIYDSLRHRVVGMAWTEDLPKQQFFDAELAKIYATLQPKFDGGYMTVESWSRDRSRVLLFGEKASDAGAYYLYDIAGEKLREIGQRYPQLSAPEHLGERRSIKYRARDGTQIPAYLTLPEGVEPKNLPLVLLVHGEENGRDDFTFDWWASFLASRGYAVLQANFRGSTGYGYDWFNAGRNGVIQTDVEDGAAALVKSGYVDAARICIVGNSYGGYAALAAAASTPDRYTCAVSVNGLSDPDEVLKDSKRYAGSEWWRKSMGSDVDHLRKVSLLTQAKQIRIPVLLLHGSDDSVVSVQQSRSMNRKLLAAHRNVRFVELGGDDHWLSSASTRTRMLQELETFLAQSLKQ